ncbi:MAG: hypothetical protein CGU28_03855 [Candidatus Dactylopiibacterium carminicum]|uniref:DUF2946 domain-containing protein n=1 Tax=Candidatus Dactylopiibacterium carminicum TaxID=857335 RepID=A0A272EXC3_9RHOO|nr:hypothetical protein [Candidatus Dactylopiibacterium carminicum]KAF7600219.1 hypothetical protein BGI27_03990 [Candidatus Dactylopiibacterium carminicum]PAS94763.1 MAG: hypothetical protein CGU29_02315 [Candidatus Dactylopiibacterium carminicum]PAS97688.1 MAG: hypothetical protein CGU28_03855 [Candidatus Dactylopiibacterium carminicum]PAT00215.1 MAG: hypothetical protein BSR46_04015 [Candidatus Dactylopiibacterium carminicum]
MRRFAHLLLLCLISLSLPLQALASVRMALPPASVEGIPALLADCSGASQVAAHGHHAQDPDDAGTQSPQKHSSMQHKACGACCMASLTTFSVPPELNLPPVSHARPGRDLAPPGHIPDGPERPPKRFS